MTASKAFILPEKCDRSPMCPAMRFCPQRAISQPASSGRSIFGGGLSVVDPEKCTGCGVCMRYCPRGAVKMQETV